VSALGFQIVVIAFASYLTWFWLIAHYPAFKLSMFSFLAPLFGLAAGGLILGERITPALGLAVILVGFGIYLVNRAKPVPGPLGHEAGGGAGDIAGQID
jgi:drug/metabolite transporter (DMT)-like permease